MFFVVVVNLQVMIPPLPNACTCCTQPVPATNHPSGEAERLASRYKNPYLPTAVHAAKEKPPTIEQHSFFATPTAHQPNNDNQHARGTKQTADTSKRLVVKPQEKPASETESNTGNERVPRLFQGAQHTDSNLDRNYFTHRCRHPR